MGATVGFSPTAFGEPVPLAPHGNVFEIDSGGLRRWSAWWKFLNVDQWGIFGLGSIAGMVLTALLTLQYVGRGAKVGAWAVANMQAEAVARVHGPLFWYLTLICGLWVLFSTQLGLVDGLPRATTDIVWTSGESLRALFGGDVRRVYYSVLAAFGLWGCIALNLAQPLTLIVISANVAAFTFVLLSIHTLVVNRRLLPAPLRPQLWREGVVALCALFYGAFVLATVGVNLFGLKP